jgi:hypothetical protein
MLIVHSLRTAAKATFAFNSLLSCRRVVILPPFTKDPAILVLTCND